MHIIQIQEAYMQKKSITLSWLLLAALILTLVLNGVANALPLFGRSTGEISDNLPNLFVPAGITFSVWGIIYLALIVFTVYQLIVVRRSPENPPYWWMHIAPWVLIGHITNSLWIIAWHALWYWSSLLLMLLLFFSLVKIVLNLRWSGRRFTAVETLCVSIPFSLYLGWITVALPANVTGLLVSLGVTSLAPGAVFWAAALAVVAGLLAVFAAVYHRDAAYSLVISWALLGIALKRSEDHPWLAGWAAALSFVCFCAAWFFVLPQKMEQEW